MSRLIPSWLRFFTKDYLKSNNTSNIEIENSFNKGRYYLNVPYHEKEIAKKEGARWHPHRKQWYTNYFGDDNQFAKWLDYEMEYTMYANEFYLASSYRNCWRCKTDTPVYALYFNKFEYADGPDEIEIGNIEVFLAEWRLESGATFFQPSGIHSDTIHVLEKNDHPMIKKLVSINKQKGKQVCQNCGAKQGNNYLFAEVDSPFVMFNNDKLKKIKLYMINVPMKINDYPGFDSSLNHNRLMKTVSIEIII